MQVAKARKQLEEIYRADITSAPARDDETGEPLWGEVTVCDSISRVDFREWLETHEGTLQRWWYEPITPATGRVIVHSLPTTVHEAPLRILRSIGKQIMQIGNDMDLIDTLETHANPTRHLTDREQLPDGQITPTALGLAVFPNLIIEVGYQNLSLREFRLKLERWMHDTNSTVQVAIGIKIFKASPSRVAILHIRNGGAPRVVEFGATVQQPPPPPLTFPLGLLYHGAPLPPQLVGHENANIVIDLVALRDAIEVEIARMQAGIQAGAQAQAQAQAQVQAQIQAQVQVQAQAGAQVNP